MTPKAEQSDLMKLTGRVKKLETSYTDLVSKIDTIIELHNKQIDLYNKQVDLLQSNLTAVTKNNDMLIEQAKGRKWGKYRQYGIYVLVVGIILMNSIFPNVGRSIREGIQITGGQVEEVRGIIAE